MLLNFLAYIIGIILSVIPWVINFEAFNLMSRVLWSAICILACVLAYISICLYNKNKEIENINKTLHIKESETSALLINRDALNELLKDRTIENESLKSELFKHMQIINSFEQSLINASIKPTKDESQIILNLHKVILNYKKFLKGD